MIKAQALADFVSEMAGASLEDTSKTKKWLLHVDGSSTTQSSDVGIVIIFPQGEDLEFAVKFGLKAYNNEAECEGLVIGMRMAHEAGAMHLIAYSDSQLLIQIPREENIKAGFLSKLANAVEDCRTRHITIQYFPKPRAPLTIQAISSTKDWRTPVIRWLEEGCLPDNIWEAARLKIRAIRFLLQGRFSTKNLIRIPCFDVCPNKKGHTSLKKHIVDVVEHMRECGRWLTKLCEQGTSGHHETRCKTTTKQI
ncbi:UNVERIFIED_CONTAM: hypothetical protein Slati_3108300 [Sesamum latifolium]|uniref:RNase H type-1 domain-containing protein n=1 Tax=Sesamum latifolium TaxID=2727402 RepID=A0AAW2UVR7_9LAMI